MNQITELVKKLQTIFISATALYGKAYALHSRKRSPNMFLSYGLQRTWATSGTIMFATFEVSLTWV